MAPITNCGARKIQISQKFSLLSLFLLMTLSALLYSAWNQYWQNAKIAELDKLVSELETESRVSARINDLLLHLAACEPLDTTTIDLLRTLAPKTPDPSADRNLKTIARYFGSCVQLIDADGTAGGLEILSLSSAIHTIPGESSSVNVLFADDRVVDVLVRTTGTRLEIHQVAMRDTNDDGMFDLVIERTPGIWESSALEDIVYLTTDKGFIPADSLRLGDQAELP